MAGRLLFHTTEDFIDLWLTVAVWMRSLLNMWTPMLSFTMGMLVWVCELLLHNSVIIITHLNNRRTSRLPVIYVFGKKFLDIEDCVARLLDSMHSSHKETKKIFLRLDVPYLHTRSESGILAATYFQPKRCRWSSSQVPRHVVTTDIYSMCRASWQDVPHETWELGPTVKLLSNNGAATGRLRYNILRWKRKPDAY